jgi:hypothetical protein
LCYRTVGEIYLSVLVNCYVFKKGIALDGMVNVGLSLFVEVDNLGITSAFEVKDTVIVPSVLVVADKQTFRIG